MRRRLAGALILLAAVAAVFWFRPMPEVSLEAQPAQPLSQVNWTDSADWFGGVSGIDIAPDGIRFHAVTDRGRLVSGRVTRTAGKITAIEILADRPVADPAEGLELRPSTDAEGVSINDATGRIFVSFEHMHRILRFDSFGADAVPLVVPSAWQALGKNAGLEALAIDRDGTILTLPEGVARGATAALIYTFNSGSEWQQSLTLPVDSGFQPVGADFGPDGRLYILERGLYLLGFRSRVRAVTLTEDGIVDIETVLETPPGRHGNLEGIAVWQDPSGDLRMVMVEDNNFIWGNATELVEYTLPPGLAQTAASD